MVKETTCEINFNPIDSVGAVYYSGQQISGNVLFTFYEKQSVKDIYLEIQGIGRCEWSDQQKNKRLYTGDEKYLSHKTEFFSANDDGLITISPGLYSFHFECDLPDNLPTSYEGKFGYIRYVAAVYIKHPLYADKFFATAFTVIKPHNLNVYPLFRRPSVTQQSMNLIRLLTFISNNLTLTATTEASAYAPGQAIEIQLDVNNKSKNNIHAFKIELIKIIIHYDKTGKNRKKQKIALTHVQLDGCAASSSTAFATEIIVPPAPPTDVTSSNLIHITYEIKISGRTGKSQFKSFIKFPITIGTVPLYTTYRCVHFEDSTENNHIVPIRYAAYVDENMDFHPRNKSIFSPVYPVYRIRNGRRKISQCQSSESSLN